MGKAEEQRQRGRRVKGEVDSHSAGTWHSGRSCAFSAIEGRSEGGL